MTPGHAEQAKLLILDDDPAIGQLMTEIARNAGVLAVSTTTAEDFFQHLQTWGPTHLALDLVMPDIDGIEVLRQLGELTCQAKVIIISGIGSRVLEAAYRSAAEHGLNVAGTISKPFSQNQLRSLLTSVEPNALGTAKLAEDQIPAKEELVTAVSLMTAIETNQIEVWYQPKVVCQTGQLVGFEALARWRHPQSGLIPPDRFIPFAEQTGLIDLLTDAIYTEALAWFSTYFAEADLLLSINLSARSLSDIRLADRIAATCQACQIHPERVILELTETSAMADPTTTLDLLTRLRIKGMQLSIDDFGVGYSSLIRLARLPFSELKIDKMFVTTAMQSSESQNIIKAIIGLGHSLGLRITAEGVEDELAFKFLQQVGCDLAQGYWLSRPMPGPAAAQWHCERLVS
ncbi:diguanylate phosphodiesterase [filamentous cyanobacterium CCP3]|nr:diguanylate phosphodiesterase [filamentous cyanobacterium CCP3]